MGKGRAGCRNDSADSPLSHAMFKDELSKLKRELLEELGQVISQTVSCHISKLEQKIAQQQKEIDSLRQVVLRGEIDKLQAARKELAPNLVIRGLTDGDTESNDELQEKVNNVVHFLDAGVEIISFCRVGRRLANNARIVKVVTRSVHERNAVLKKCKLLRGRPEFTDVYIDSDKCFLDRRENDRLRKKVKLLRSENPNKQVRLFKGKILVDGDEVDHAEPLRHLLPTE